MGGEEGKEGREGTLVACGEEERVRVGGNVMVGPCVAVYTLVVYEQSLNHLSL